MVVKVFPWKSASSAQVEVAAAVMLPPHPSIQQPMDVATTLTDIRVLYPLLPLDVGSWSEATYKGAGGLHEEVYRYILWHLLSGAGHLHTHGLLHGDIKPSNIIVRGTLLPGLGPSAAELAGTGMFLDGASWGQDDAVEKLAERLQQLPKLFSVWFRRPRLC